ncbi:MAG TPA: hypothetical protein VG105_08610 [Paraburkholderia sp.]|jgi:hypothetical protein|nr:hypothetical protein [Paraburkholderia sp.]
MVAADNSLRVLVEKWLGAASVKPIRVLLTQRSRSGRICRVCVEGHCPSGPVTLFFFRHDDGSWHVFPPANRGPAMSIGRLAA